MKNEIKEWFICVFAMCLSAGIGASFGAYIAKDYGYRMGQADAVAGRQHWKPIGHEIYYWDDKATPPPAPAR